MDVTALATAAVAMLAPYLGKAAEAVSKKAGESAAHGAGRVYHWLKNKLAGHRATEALEDLAAQPQDGDLQAALRVQLRKALQGDPRLAEELAALLREVAPDAASVSQAQIIAGDGAAGVQVAGDGNAVDIR